MRTVGIGWQLEPHQFFKSTCANRHGAQGQTALGPDLREVERKGDALMAMRIKEGSPKGMLAFKDQLREPELESLLEDVEGL